MCHIDSDTRQPALTGPSVTLDETQPIQSRSPLPVFLCSQAFPGIRPVGPSIALWRSGMKANAKAKRVREGRYANYYEIGYNLYEFYFDFGQYDPQTEKVQMHTRIMTSPAYAKMLRETLTSSVEGFEREHGPIPANSEEVDAMEIVRESLKRTET